MGLVRFARPERSKPAKTKGRVVSRVEVLDTIDEATRDNVLNDILDSFIDMPVQSDEYRVNITKELAAHYALSLMQVAGVRAALTRGRYGDIEQLTQERTKIRGLVQHRISQG